MDRRVDGKCTRDGRLSKSGVGSVAVAGKDGETYNLRSSHPAVAKALAKSKEGASILAAGSVRRGRKTIAMTVDECVWIRYGRSAAGRSSLA